MNEIPRAIRLAPCLKGYARDQDKAVNPTETIVRVRKALCHSGLKILSETRRVDTGRLGIPVYLSICGEDARALMPTRKQMGKGASAEQAEASALMELMERYAFFSFWKRRKGMRVVSWAEAEELFGRELIGIEEILLSVDDCLPVAKAREILQLVPWSFYPASNLASGEITWLPLDWFRMLGEFNGSSAGNTAEESLLQGLSELIERHVCCKIDRQRPYLPTIIPQSCACDDVLAGLISAFAKQGVSLVLKDFSQGMPLPTVGALAWDSATLPKSSEIVFTAGTASSPQKAAIRAITEVAQLGGDFCTNSCYEASGLPKFASLEQCAWLLAGPEISLQDLPSLEAQDICKELLDAIKKLAPLNVYAIETSVPALQIPAHYCIVPGLTFRERDRNQSLGLFVGRKLAEQCAPEQARQGLAHLGKICPDAHYLPFFDGLLALRNNDAQSARSFFQTAQDIQPDAESTALCSFYSGYAATIQNIWDMAIPDLARAVELCPEMKEYANLLGVAHFKNGDYARAADAFQAVLKLDKGSALDRANLGLAYKFLGQKEDAIRELNASLALDSELAFAREHLQELLAGA